MTLSKRIARWREMNDAGSCRQYSEGSVMGEQVSFSPVGVCARPTAATKATQKILHLMADPVDFSIGLHPPDIS